MNEREGLIVRPAADLKLEGLFASPQSNNGLGYGYPVGTEVEPERHILTYWHAVRKHLWLVVGVTLLITALVAIYVARQPDIYLARARVQVDLESPNSLLGGRNGSVIVSTQANEPTYFNTQLQMLSSPEILERVVKTLDLENDGELFNPRSVREHSTRETLLRMLFLKRPEVASARKDLRSTPPLRPSSIAPAESRDDLEENERLVPYVLALQSGLAIEPVQEARLPIKETRLIDIGFTHADPRFAARIANAIAETYVLANLERKTEAGTLTGDFFAKRVAELQSQIRAGEEQLVNYAKDHQILSLDGSQNTVVERLAGLNRQLLEAENERKLAEAAYKTALGPGALDALAEGNSRLATETEIKLAELRLRRAQLLVETTEKWPEVQEIDKQVAVLEQQLKDTRSRATSTLSTNLATRYQQALAREQALRSAFEKQKGETVTQNEAAINYRILQQENQTNKSLLDGLLQRAKENEVMLAGTTNNVHINNYALAPRDSIEPRRIRAVAIAMLVSLALGIGLAIFLDYLDNTIRDSEDVERFLHLPTLVVIPEIKGSLKRTAKQKALPTEGLLQLGKRTGSPELLIDVDGSSPLAEAYKQLRTLVLLSTAGRAPKTLLVTSARESEGKTTTAVNVAISLAQTGASVLLLEGDLRRPRFQEFFGIESDCGLSNYLSSEMSTPELRDVIWQDTSTNLHVLQAGSLPPNPAELLGSDRMRQLLRDLEKTFTYIVIDSPPITAVTDAVLIGSMVDGVLMVVQQGVCSREAADRTRQLLQGVGAKIVGVVLNKTSAKRAKYYSAKYAYESRSHEGTLVVSNSR